MGFFSAKFENEYTLGKRIFNGAKFQVRECRGIKDERDYVVKIYASDLEEVNTIRYEYHLFVKNKINSIPNVLRLKDCFFDKYYVYYVIQRYYGNDLFRTVMNGHKYSEYDLSCYFRQLFRCLSALHGMNIVHRRISGKNLVFLEKENKTLVLKGTRYILSTHEFSKFNVVVEHSIQYLSPEIISQETNLHNIMKSDVWACGVILYTLLFGNNLFPIEFPYEKYAQNIVKCRINWLHDSPLLKSKLAVDFCKSLLKQNPSERFSAKEALFHPWISGDKMYSHNTELASDRFYSEVKNAIDELDTLDENTSRQYRHKFNDEKPLNSSSHLTLNKVSPGHTFGTGTSVSSRSSRLTTADSTVRIRNKCLPFNFRIPSFKFFKFKSKQRDKKPLMENPVVDKYIKDDEAE
ncbi:protein kinase, putative [Theileria annulata]|uniref:Protein kinase, putative n=1 Tax=Theileria annulata TaxID=5874 RepID=Q4UIM2_THEAN|nr:protein kinase, putative [Theileria annulata]CAI73067.1 protein kinase, putative [Theileria annulata]|eukprot:XP_953745.1 protein kinase, putative [Theileria annulata]